MPAETIGEEGEEEGDETAERGEWMSSNMAVPNLTSGAPKADSARTCIGEQGDFTPRMTPAFSSLSLSSSRSCAFASLFGHRIEEDARRVEYGVFF